MTFARIRSVAFVVFLLVVLCVSPIDSEAQQVYCALGTPVCDPTVPGTPCYDPNPPSPVCEICPKNCTGSPCFLGTGAYTADVTDLELPTNGLPLQIGRRYLSTTQTDSAVGRGWRSNLAPRIRLLGRRTALRKVIRGFPGGPPGQEYYYSQEFVNYWAVIGLPNSQEYYFPGVVQGDYYQISSNPRVLQVQIGFSPPSGRKDTLVRNSDASWDMTLQRSRTKYHFTPRGMLETITDEFGNRILYRYDTSDRVIRIEDQSGTGRYLDIYWGPNGRIDRVVDSASRTVRYQYSLEGMLTRVTDPAGRDTSYEYAQNSAQGAPHLARIKDHWNRVVSDLTWGGARLSSYTEEGERWSYSYGAGITTKTDSSGNAWNYPIGQNGLVPEDRPPGGGTPLKTFFNSDGTIQQTTDQTGVVTFYGYNAEGSVTSVSRDSDGPLRIRWEYTYHPTWSDKVISVLPGNLAQGTYKPDWQGWKYDYYDTTAPAPGALERVQRVRNDGTTLDTLATYSYDGKGRVTSVSDAAGGQTDYGYDAAGNLSTVTAPANNDGGVRPVTTYGYDAAGRVTSVTDPLGHTSSYTYDGVGRVLSVTLPKPVAGSPLNFVTTYSYDNYDAASGLSFTHVTDPNGRLTRQGYDQFGRLVKSIDALGAVTTYGYSRGLLASITDAHDYTTSYEYDPLRRLSATVFPDAARESYTYWPDGLLKTKTDRKNQTIQYDYDRLKRLKKKLYPNGSYIEYTYVGQKLTQVYDTSTTPAETHTFGYDGSYRVSSNTQGPRGAISYTYQPTDAVASYTVTGGPTASYSYYPDGSLNTIQWTPVAGEFKYRYTRAGQYETVTFPNGQTRNYSYDDQGRLLQLANLHPTAGNLATYAYGYDVNHYDGTPTMLGQRVTMTANVPAQGFSDALTKYYYDAASQVTRVDYPSTAPFNGAVNQWTYDLVGNRTAAIVNGDMRTYTYQQLGSNSRNWHRLLSDGVRDYSYDANGNTQTRTGATLAWSIDNRLAAITTAPTSNYSFDYQGRRVGMTDDTSQTSTLYVGLHPIRYSATVASDNLPGRGLDELLARFEGSSIRFAVLNDLDSIVAFVNDSGTSLSTFTYDVWGVALNGASTLRTPLYAGREATGSDFLQYRFREYNPSTGRFLSEDPLQELLPIVGGQLYSYVNNSPVVFTDPLGLVKCNQTTKYGQKQTHHTIGEEWKKTGELQYPDLGALSKPAKYILSKIKWGSPKKGFQTFGFTIIECFWTKYLVTTHYWSQEYTINVTCDCPSNSWSDSGTKTGFIGGTRQIIDHGKTFGSIGFQYEPCQKPAY